MFVQSKQSATIGEIFIVSFIFHLNKIKFTKKSKKIQMRKIGEYTINVHACSRVPLGKEECVERMLYRVVFIDINKFFELYFGSFTAQSQLNI